MSKNLGIEPSPQFENNPYVEVVDNADAVHEYLNFCIVQGDEEASRILDLIRDNPGAPVLLLRCVPEHFFDNTDELFSILESYNICLDRDGHIDMLMQELDAMYQYDLFKFYYRQGSDREKRVLKLLNNAKDPILPIRQLKSVPKYNLMWACMQRSLKYGIQGRTFVAIGGTYPTIMAIDEISFTLNPDNQKALITNHTNFFLLKMFKDKKDQLDSHDRLTHNRFLHES